MPCRSPRPARTGRHGAHAAPCMQCSPQQITVARPSGPPLPVARPSGPPLPVATVGNVELLPPCLTVAGATSRAAGHQSGVHGRCTQQPFIDVQVPP